MLTEFKPATLHYVSVIAIYLLSNKTLLMAVPLFTVLLNNVTFFFKNLIMGSMGQGRKL